MTRRLTDAEIEAALTRIIDADGELLDALETYPIEDVAAEFGIDLNH